MEHQEKTGSWTWDMGYGIEIQHRGANKRSWEGVDRAR